MPLMIDGHTITGNKCVKLLAIKIDNNLSFNDHVPTTVHPRLAEPRLSEPRLSEQESP